MLIWDWNLSKAVYDKTNVFYLFQVPAGTFLVFLSFVNVGRTLFLVRPRSRPYDRETSSIYLGPTRNTTSRHRTEQYPDPMDWHCRSDTRWRDLGERHYPRFIKETTCSSDSCFYGFYSCRAEYYQLVVLSIRDRYSSLETALPPQLRNEWKFNRVEVPVACKCVQWRDIVLVDQDRGVAREAGVLSKLSFKTMQI